MLMCGDGTNDVGALGQAHIGVGLLEAQPVRASSARARHQSALAGVERLLWRKRNPRRPMLRRYGAFKGCPVRA